MPPLRAIMWLAVSSRKQAEPDKVSFDVQERAIREYADREGYQIIDTLRVDGHSRKDAHLERLFQLYRKKRMYAYDQLRTHFEAKDFDILIAHDPSRVGRSQTLVPWVFENVINSGASVHILNNGGCFDESNVEIGIAMCSLTAVAGERKRVKMTKEAKDKRLEEGLQASRPPFTHRVVYSITTGEGERLELRSELRQVLDDAAKLLLEGEGWTTFSIAMYERFGHINPQTGKPYGSAHFYRVFHNPYTWGYTGKGWALSGGQKVGAWAFDPDVPTPEGVIVNYNPEKPVPPVYTGTLATRIKAELHRRIASIKGRAKARSYAFTGILMCGDCGRRMGIESNRSHIYNYWRCAYRQRRYFNVCHSKRVIRDDKVQEYLNDFLDSLLSLHPTNFAAFIGESDTQVQEIERNIARLSAEKEETQRQIDALIRTQAQHRDPVVQDSYTRLIAESGERSRVITEQLIQLQEQIAETDHVVQARQAAIDDIEKLTLKKFWKASPRFINQTLHRILGRFRFVVLNGEITGVRLSSNIVG